MLLIEVKQLELSALEIEQEKLDKLTDELHSFSNTPSSHEGAEALDDAKYAVQKQQKVVDKIKAASILMRRFSQTPTKRR